MKQLMVTSSTQSNDSEHDPSENELDLNVKMNEFDKTRSMRSMSAVSTSEVKFMQSDI